MAVTIATVIKNVCLSRHWKAELVIFRTSIQTPASFTHHVAQKPDQTPVYQSVQNLPRTGTWIQNAIATKPYVKTGRMSNQKKAEFVDDIFHIWSFWRGHGEISPKTWFMHEGTMCPEILIQQPVEFPTAITRKSLTIWSRLMDHRKAERVIYQNGIRDFQSFGQFETGNWRSILPLFYSETDFCIYFSSYWFGVSDILMSVF
jgi:hypothetical protein